MTTVDQTKLQKRLEKIVELTKKREEIDKELAILTGMMVETTPPPKGFDYKSAVLSLFKENPSVEFSIDEAVQRVSSQYKFTAEKEAVARRLNYLTDRDKTLERVAGRRGVYCLRKNPEEHANDAGLIIAN